MSVEPVTITTTYDHPLFDPEEHRKLAAEQLGLDGEEIHCIDTGPDRVDIVSPEVYSEDGTLLTQRVLAYTRITTWAERPRAVRTEEPERVEVPALVHNVPTLHRGARWHGLLDGAEVEADYISTGEKLVLLESEEGAAVIKALVEEHAAHLAATGG